MNELTDRLTLIERQGTTDCLVELATQWLQRPFAEMSEGARGQAINEMCLLISQMRHMDSKIMDRERSRWVERVAARLCSQCAAMDGYQGAVRMELERRVTVAMLTYHDWREKNARHFSERSAS